VKDQELEKVAATLGTKAVELEVDTGGSKAKMSLETVSTIEFSGSEKY
jgi:hypothetical protein